MIWLGVFLLLLTLTLIIYTDKNTLAAASAFIIALTGTIIILVYILLEVI